ncbi:MAG: (Fe-S)-binding protein [Hyphomicrobiaceae bacterium]
MALASSETARTRSERPRVGLLVTCLVDLFRPSVGFAAVKLLEDAGCLVEAPGVQTCCGQPAYNSGARSDAIDLACQTIAAFEGFDYVVTPSGSCGGMLRKHYPELLKAEPEWSGRAASLAAKTYELVSFLVDVMGVTKVDVSWPAKAAYHDACSGLRELGVREQPRKLLNTISGLEIVEVADRDACCGFGGTFSVKYPEISNAIVADKTKRVAETGCNLLIAGDLGCLLNLAGKIGREGRQIEVRHVAEVLAGQSGTPPIGGRS